MRLIKSILSADYAIWVFSILLLVGNIFQYLFYYLGSDSSLSNYVFYLAFLYVGIVIIQSGIVIKRIVAFLLIFFLLLSLQYLIHPNNSQFLLESLKPILLSCLPYYMVGACITDFKKVISNMERILPIFALLVPLLIYMFYSGMASTETSNYMTVAYQITLPILLMGICGVKNRNFIWICLFSLFAIALLFIGCRGAFIAVILPILYLYWNERKQNRIRFILTVMILLFIVTFFLYDILYLIEGILNSIGFNSRIVDKIEFGRLLESQGREIIRERVLSRARSDGFPPYGLFGDRYLMSTSSLNGSYVHNIVLEIIIDFGIVLGSIILLSFFVYTIRKYRNGSFYYKLSLLIFLGMSLLKLMFSSSYLIEPIFYCGLGVLFNNNVSSMNLFRIE